MDRRPPHDHDSAGLTVHQEDPYRVQVEKAITAAVGGRIAKDLENTPLTEESHRRDFAERKVRLYDDALGRGEEPFWKKLRQEGLTVSVFDGRVEKTYAYQNGQIFWQLKPKSQDPFETAQFYRDAQNEAVATSGNTDLWTDPVLINQVLEEGIRTQNQHYTSFTTLTGRIHQLRQTARGVLDILPPLSHTAEGENGVFESLETEKYEDQYFAQIDSAVGQLGLMGDDQRRDYFVEHFVLTNHPLLGQMERASEFCRNIEILNGLFPAAKLPSPSHRRPAFENTIVVELLTNPASFKDPDFLKNPWTTLERFLKAAALVTQLAPHDLETAYYWVFEQAQAEFAQAFLTLGLDQQLGRTYFQNLLLHKIKKLPGVSHVSGDKLRKDAYLLNNLYRLDTAIPQPDMPPAEPKKPDIREMAKSTFNRGEITKLNPRDRKKFFDLFLTTIIKAGERPRVEDLKRIFRTLQISYSPTEKALKTTAKEKQAQSAEIAAEFLKTCQARLKKGDRGLLELFEEYITRGIWQAYLDARKIPQNLETAAFVERVINDYRFEAINQEQALELLSLALMAIAGENINDTSGIYLKNQVRQLASGIIRRQYDEETQNEKKETGRKKKQPLGPEKLVELGALFQAATPTRTDLLVARDIAINHLSSSDLIENRDRFITAVIQSSIKNLLQSQKSHAGEK